MLKLDSFLGTHTSNLQACRGTKLDNGMELPDSANDKCENMVQSDGADEVDGQTDRKQTIPVEADFFFGHCTVSGKHSLTKERSCEIHQKFNQMT